MATKKKIVDLVEPIVETEPFQCCGKDECEVCPFDEPKDEPIVVQPKVADSYVAVDGDTYPSIAGKFKPNGMTKHEYAMKLVEINRGVSVRAGMIVKLQVSNG